MWKNCYDPIKNNFVIGIVEIIKKNPKNAHAHFRRAFSHKALKNYS